MVADIFIVRGRNQQGRLSPAIMNEMHALCVHAYAAQLAHKTPEPGSRGSGASASGHYKSLSRRSGLVAEGVSN